MRGAAWCGAVLSIFCSGALELRAQSAAAGRAEVLVTDVDGKGILGVLVDFINEGHPVRSAETNELGRVVFSGMRTGRYTVTAKRAGFETLTRGDIDLGSNVLALELTLVPSLARSESVEVRGTALEVEEATATPNRLPPNQAKELPSRPATVADALPLTPGVVREPGGGLILSSSPENRSALIVNSADVTDPATGQFGLTVPIDSVEVLSVYQAAYLAEFGRFTAGLVSVETKRGGEKWKWELNDPLPEFRIRSYHLRGLKTATPRLNFEGPIVANKLFVSEGFEYEVRKTAVYTLPFPFNQKKQEGINSFTQLDWVQSSTHLVTATVHLAPQRLNGLTIDYYNPLPTSPDARTRNITGTITDHWTVGHGLLETRFWVTKFDADAWGKGTSDFVMSPTGNSGTFFGDQDRTASRISGHTRYSFAPFNALGSHQFKIGAALASSEQDGSVSRRAIDIVDQAGNRVERIGFSRVRDFEVSDIEKSFFGQDHWILTPRLAVDIGARTESQQISGAFRVAPRFGAAWTLSNTTKTVLRGGFGLFYDRVPLNVYAFNRYPNRTIIYYDQSGDVASGPFVFVNTLGQSRVRFPFVSQRPVDGNFSPRSSIWSAQIEQPVTPWLRIRATYLRNYADGLVVLNVVAPDPVTSYGSYLLEGTGESRYRQFDVLAHVRLREDRQLFFSYAHSFARGDLNDFGRFLGTVPASIMRPNYVGTLSTDLPNRILTWGVFRLPHKFQVAPVIEYRTGFPYSALNQYQNYAGEPNSRRYPNFLAVDSRFSKDLKVNAKYSVRLSITGFNLTNHFNPEAVRMNVADPAFGYFFGHRGRRFTADFDFLF